MNECIGGEKERYYYNCVVRMEEMNAQTRDIRRLTY